MVQKEVKKVKFSKISSARKDNTKGVSLLVNYHPSLKNIDQKFQQKFTPSLYGSIS